MNDSRKLKQARKRAALTQMQVADALGVPRELISMWENGARAPKPEHVTSLSELYRVDESFLRGAGNAGEEKRRNVFYRNVSAAGRPSSHGREEIDRWLGFLDDWADFLAEIGEISKDSVSPSKPPRELDEGSTVTDARRASTLASATRRHYDLGCDAIPDLYAFLDEIGVLVYKTDALGRVSSSRESVSGALYNHPRLGFCILLNSDCSEGRQAFTLAHEFAHALYHYREQALVSVSTDDHPRERFANAFSAYFLVPARTLREMARSEKKKRDELSPYSALRFAAYFRVSYLMMLIRLHEERQITRRQVNEWKGYSPMAMARRIGMNAGFLMSPSSSSGAVRDGLDQYPSSIIDKVRWALATDRITPGEAASLLNIEADAQELVDELLDFPFQDEEGTEDLDEYPVRWRDSS